MTKTAPINLQNALNALIPLADRTPETPAEEAAQSFAELSNYRDGGIFVAAFTGNSEWERHSNGDELVLAIEGSTDLILLQDNTEVRHHLAAGELIVVPRDTWHRFESTGVKLLTVTPQPTDHRGL